MPRLSTPEMSFPSAAAKSSKPSSCVDPVSVLVPAPGAVSMVIWPLVERSTSSWVERSISFKNMSGVLAGTLTALTSAPGGSVPQLLLMHCMAIFR